MNFSGNQDILKLNKIGFLSSQKCPAHVVLNSYEWAKQQRSLGVCIICGNHSQIEKDVFEILLKGKQPLILVLARGIKKRWDKKMLQAIEDKRLLIIAPFPENISRVTRDTAFLRNQKIAEISDEIHVGHVSSGGQLEKILINKPFSLI